MADLVVNADDYGLTIGVSRAIVRAHRHGVVTSTSVMAASPAFQTTVGWLDDVPDLGVGLHLTAVGEDPPLLSAAEVSTLVDRHGNLAVSSVRMVPRLVAGQVDPADLEREFTAQYEAFTATGRHPTHLDTHHNLHLWPMVSEVVIRLAERWAVPAVRVPWSRAGTPIGMGVRRLASSLRDRVDGAGLWRPDVFYGIDEGGRLDTPTLLGLVDRWPADADVSVEVATHPGIPDDPDLGRYPWRGASRPAELESLTSPEVTARIRDGGHRLTTYGPTAVTGSPPVSLDLTSRETDLGDAVRA